MTRTCWRALAGILAVSLGAIVVCACDQEPKSCQNANPATAEQRCSYEPCCTMPVPVACTQHSGEPACVRVPDCPVCPAAVEPSPVPCVVPIAPPTTIVIPPTDTVAPEAAVVPAMVNPPAVLTNIPYRVRMEMIGGITQVELLRGDEVALKVQCDRVDLQMPAGGLHAIGKVSVMAPGLDVRCNRLMIGWQNGDIAMEGQVRILCRNGQQKTEMSAESVNCRLNHISSGLEIGGAGVITTNGQQ